MVGREFVRKGSNFTNLMDELDFQNLLRYYNRYRNFINILTESSGDEITYIENFTSQNFYSETLKLHELVKKKNIDFDHFLKFEFCY